MCSTYCVSMFLCLLYAPSHQKKFQVGVNLLGNKSHSDSDSDSDSDDPAPSPRDEILTSFPHADVMCCCKQCN